MSQTGGVAAKIGASYEAAWVARELVRLAMHGTDDGRMEIESPTGGDGAEMRVTRDGKHWIRHQCKNKAPSALQWTGAQFIDNLLAGAEDAADAGEGFVVASGSPAGQLEVLSRVAASWKPDDFVEDLGEPALAQLKSIQDALATDSSDGLSAAHAVLRNVQWVHSSIKEIADSLLDYLKRVAANLGLDPDDLVGRLEKRAATAGEVSRQDVLEKLVGPGLSPEEVAAALGRALTSRSETSAEARCRRLDKALADGTWLPAVLRGAVLEDCMRDALELAGVDKPAVSTPTFEADVRTFPTPSGPQPYAWIDLAAHQGTLVIAVPSSKVGTSERRFAFGDHAELTTHTQGAVSWAMEEAAYQSSIATRTPAGRAQKFPGRSP